MSWSLEKLCGIASRISSPVIVRRTYFLPKRADYTNEGREGFLTAGHVAKLDRSNDGALQNGLETVAGAQTPGMLRQNTFHSESDCSALLMAALCERTCDVQRAGMWGAEDERCP